jgi:hypothetical protein
MTDSMEFCTHAARCDRLADSCRDTFVAEKLRQLAREYRELAHTNCPSSTCVHLVGDKKSLIDAVEKRE